MPAFGEHRKPFYPGLTPKEALVWRAWLREREGSFDRFDYDVHVGDGVRVPEKPITGDPAFDAKMREAFRQATQRRIDCIGFQGNEAWLIEVEDRADARALGQLILYDELAPRSIPNLGPVQLSVVCRYIGPDMLALFEKQGVVVFVVPNA